MQCVPAAGGGVCHTWPNILCLGRMVAGLLQAVDLFCGLNWVESEVSLVAVMLFHIFGAFP